MGPATNCSSLGVIACQSRKQEARQQLGLKPLVLTGKAAHFGLVALASAVALQVMRGIDGGDLQVAATRRIGVEIYHPLPTLLILLKVLYVPEQHGTLQNSFMEIPG